MPTPEEIEAYFISKGTTTAQAKANLMKRGYSEEYAEKELPVGLLCEQILEKFRQHANDDGFREFFETCRIEV